MAEKKEENTENKENEKVAQKSKLPLFAGIGGVLFAALCLGGFFIFKTLGSHAPATPPPADATADNNTDNKKPDDKKPDDKKPDDKKPDDKKPDDKKTDDKKPDDKKPDDKKPDDSHGDAKATDKKPDVKGTNNFGDTYTLSRMDLNLGNPIENRYLRVAVSIEFRGGEEQLDELKQREPQIKDIIITTVTNKTRLELLSENGKEDLRRELMNRINEVCDRPIQNIYFTEFLVE
jgi:flagellar basal body-associated protein FliL